MRAQRTLCEGGCYKAAFGKGLGAAGEVLQEWRRQGSTPEVVPGAALPWLELGRVGGQVVLNLK